MESKVNENLNTDWWFNYQEFYKTIANKNYDILVEIGVWKGHSISFLANQFKSSSKTPKIYAVDLWDETYKWEDNKTLRDQVPILYKIYNENLKINGVRDMIVDLKGVSWDMANNFEDSSVDFVFIDADHEYESVVKDINAWTPKIRKGGMISGHDYLNPCGVKDAVNELVQGFKLTNDGVWYKIIE